MMEDAGIERAGSGTSAVAVDTERARGPAPASGTVAGAAVVAALSLTLAACGEDAGLAPSGTSAVSVVMQAGDVGASAVRGPSAGVAADAELSGLADVTVTLDDVSAIEVTVSSVEVHVRDADGDGDGEDGGDEDRGGWFALELQGEPPRIDLTDLENAGPVQLAVGELQAGQQVDRVRFFVDMPRITFTRDVTFPPTGPNAEVVCQQDAPCPFTIPSEQQTGLKVDVTDFTVGEEEVITVEVDPQATVRAVVISANGVMVPPVLSARGGA